MVKESDVLVVGAGFFGCRLALKLSREGLSVALLDAAASVCTRASYRNQARIHNGYHYPRSYATALGSHKHYDRFRSEMADCVDDDFTHLYAIARESFTSAYQFQRFCESLELPIAPVPRRLRRLFDDNRIDEVFEVREGAFDARALAERLQREIEAQPLVDVSLNTVCTSVDLSGARVRAETSAGEYRARGAFIVTYADINHLLASSGLAPLDLRAEIAEICLVDVPEELKGLGVTVMDGPFFSCMPMPAERCYSLTHVRYTPQASWNLLDHPVNATRVLESTAPETRFPFMQRDAQLYLPALSGLHHRRSLFEVKAVPNKHEADDGRPILFRVHNEDPFCASVLGSKIDSIFELEEAVPIVLRRWFR